LRGGGKKKLKEKENKGLMGETNVTGYFSMQLLKGSVVIPDDDMQAKGQGEKTEKEEKREIQMRRV